jgi:RNA recognition motif-containing protein
LWQKITAFFGSANNNSSKTAARPARDSAPRNGSAPERNGAPKPRERERERVTRRPESIEVTTPRLYVGNLSFEASESDLFELFNGVGQVQNAEVVTYKHNQRSKGFAFVQMQSVEEAKRAVAELHDKEFLGRKLVVSGAKSDTHTRE